MKVGQRIKARRKELGLYQKDLTKAGVSVSAVSQWEQGLNFPKGNHLMALANILDCRPDWIMNGGKNPPLGLSNISDGPPIKQMIPVISWVQAGEFCGAEILEPYEVEEWMPCPANASLRTYGLRVKGDSMTAAHVGERSYPEGIVIFVDPERDVRPGCRVIATVPESQEATFKTLVEDAGVRYLKPINTHYKMRELTPEMKICGVVIGSYWPE